MPALLSSYRHRRVKIPLIKGAFLALERVRNRTYDVDTLSGDRERRSLDRGSLDPLEVVLPVRT